MDYKALWDYADALKKHSEALQREGLVDRSIVFERYADTINTAANQLRHKIQPDRLEAASYCRDLRHLFSPGEIERHISEHRRSDVYRATSALASAMERIAAGKSPRGLLGLFG